MDCNIKEVIKMKTELTIIDFLELESLLYFIKFSIENNENIIITKIGFADIERLSITYYDIDKDKSNLLLPKFKKSTKYSYLEVDKDYKYEDLFELINNFLPEGE